ncbi:GGDEF domain-containing protein [Comamonas sp. NLF-1-9]|uniref:GGDEF domain-containing protein n=1 Tax=Comamonas sp. NLF-1-9 TaxID=2853163 RepID=UPI001C4917D3|nr:GGDEF domain-containing protein [Comamonas sp. NLF-1-9]QXL83833.1 GGDEF domain-containing protein [Comamonas sp. NLF-1-9]
MQPLLQNLAEMTTHRDHLRLEVSVLSTIFSLGRMLQVRSLELFSLAGALRVRPRCWSEDGRIVCSPHEAADDPGALELEQMPELDQCIRERGASAERSMNGEHVLWLPVWLGDHVATCLEVTRSRRITQHQREVITGVFLVYQNYQSLLDYSERDALTGLLNRKTFDEQFARYSELPGGDKESGQWLAVIDIDHFKLVNDRFGHLYGDEVLILLANRLRAQFRSQDRIFRFGGEEFVVLLRSISLEHARAALERLRAAIEAHEFPQIGHITISIGFAAATLDTPVEIIGRADQALYHAKEHGRNQVRFYDDLVASGELQSKVAHSDIELF